MKGFYESRLERIAQAPRYGPELTFAATRTSYETAGAAWNRASADPGISGETGSAASASFHNSATKTLAHADELARLPAIISELNSALDEAWNILDGLPATSVAEQRLAAAFADTLSTSPIVKSAQLANAFAELQLARAAREAAARAGHMSLCDQFQYTQEKLNSVIANLGFEGNHSGSSGSDSKLNLEEILRRYQIADDPKNGGRADLWDPYDIPNGFAAWLLGLFGQNLNTRLTAREKDLLEDMWVWELKDAYDIQKSAQGTAEDRFPVGTGLPSNYDANDAFRHSYWSALLTKRFGPDWAKEFTSAHEGYHSNPGPAEAMDLYNNEVGRKFALANPHASETELANLLEQAVRNGDLITIDGDKNLQWSDYEGPHPGPNDFDEAEGTDSLLGRDRNDFGVDDRTHHPIPRPGTGHW